MASVNAKTKSAPLRTYEGAIATRNTPLKQLSRLVMCNLLWENQFYLDGVSTANMIKDLVHTVSLEDAAVIAIAARDDMHLRHVPLLIVREMARHPKLASNPKIVSQTLSHIIQRADELNEFVALYWKDGKQPLSKQVKLGLSQAFNKFSEYELAKYNRDKDVRLRDVLFLCHAKPNDVAPNSKRTKTERLAEKGNPVDLTDKESLFLKVVNDSLATPDTWETRLSGGADKRQAFTELMAERKLGAMAFIRNLRNMAEAGIDKATLKAYGDSINFNKLLPFRFIASARAVPQLEDIIEPWMLKGLDTEQKMEGSTLLLVDVSGSMDSLLSSKSDMKRTDAAYGLAILLREICSDITVASFSTHLKIVAPRRGFALRDAIHSSQPHSATYLGKALAEATKDKTYDRIIVITDEQSSDQVPKVRNGYCINIASSTCGVATKGWVRIDGWSDAVVKFIQAYEAEKVPV